MAFIAAEWLNSVWNRQAEVTMAQRMLIMFHAGLLGSGLIILTLSDIWLPELAKAMDPTDVSSRSMMLLPLNWEGWEPVIGLILLFGTTSSVILWRAISAKVGLSILLVTTFSTFWLAQVSIIPRVNELTQKGVITYYQETAVRYDKVYFEPLVHHSYAHLFYGARKPDQHEKATEEHWLLTGDVDAPVFFLIKKNRFEEFLGYHPHLIIVDEWGPYYFLTRNDEGYLFRGSR